MTEQRFSAGWDQQRIRRLMAKLDARTDEEWIAADGAAHEGEGVGMSTVQQLESTVRQLSAEELAAFRAWFAEFDAERWDRQLEADVAAGRLDWLVEEARRDLREGRCTDR